MKYLVEYQYVPENKSYLEENTFITNGPKDFNKADYVIRSYITKCHSKDTIRDIRIRSFDFIENVKIKFDGE